MPVEWKSVSVKGGKKDGKTFSWRSAQPFDSFNCEQQLGECEIQYEKKNINLLTMFPPNMFWLYWNWISIFVSSHSTRQYICPIASGSVQTWNRVSKFLRFCLCRFFSLFFPSFYRINFRLTLQWIHIYDDYFNNIQFIHSEFAFNAHFTQGQRGETSEGEAELTMESMTIAMRAGGCWQVYRLWFQIPFCSWTNFNKRRKCLIKLVSSSVNSKLINSCWASM